MDDSVNCIHQVWLQGGEAYKNRPSCVRSVESWKDCNPGWAHRVWSEACIIQAIKTSGEHDLVSMYTSCSPWIGRLDLAKYILLYLYGGIYADMDTTCVRSFDDLIAASSSDGTPDLLVCECDGSIQTLFIKGLFGLPAWASMINTGVFVSLRKRSPVLGSLLSNMRAAMANHDMATITGIEYLDMLGPPMFTRTLRTADNQRAVRMLPFQAFESCRSEVDMTQQTQYVIHHHGQSWVPWYPDVVMLTELQPYLNPALIACLAVACVSASAAALLPPNKRRARSACAVTSLACALCAFTWPYMFKKYLKMRYQETPLSPMPSLHMPPYFFDPCRFTFLKPLSDSWELLAKEAQRAMAAAPILEHVHRSAEQWVGDDAFFVDQLQEYGWVRAWQSASHGPNGDWLNYGLMYKGDFFAANASKCPTLTKLLAPMRHRINICGFSWMRPLSKIHRHVDSTGVKHGSLAYHLGLIVPSVISGACKLTVANVAAMQRPGQPIVFDSSFSHYAENNAAGDRVILYIDFKI